MCDQVSSFPDCPALTEREAYIILKTLLLRNRIIRTFLGYPHFQHMREPIQYCETGFFITTTEDDPRGPGGKLFLRMNKDFYIQKLADEVIT